MSDSDYYEILGVDRDAELAAVKRAYRASAIRDHPDKNPGDAAAEERFKQAAEAYAVLSDPEKRRIYDQYGRAGLDGSAFRGFDDAAFADFGDILGDLFGLGNIFGGGARRRARRGAGRDLRYDLEIDFEDAVRGLETKVRLARLETCGDCEGRGAEPGGVQTCATCGGRGQVAFQQGFFTIARACDRCRGTGRRITKPCASCEGRGRIEGEQTLSLRIPAGVDTGTRIRVAGHGEGGTGGGPPGDLYVVLHVREHEVFARQDRDLHCLVPVTFSQAALGARIRVPTIDGDEELNVPSGTQSGRQFRLSGRGVPAINGGARGDQFVTVHVRTPTRLTKDQRRLFEQLAENEDDPTDDPSLFDRVKNIFG